MSVIIKRTTLCNTYSQVILTASFQTDLG